MQTYFRDTHPDLADRLDGHLQRVRDGCPPAVKPLVSGLVLGGGYGRGEGGVLETPAGPQLFNDLDYFLFSSQPADAGLLAWVRSWEKEETAALGIDVECVVLGEDKLRNPGITMMFSDLAHGHRVVMGGDALLANWKEMLDPALIPLGEATRLLWNRGTGLYLCSVELSADEPDPTFVQRNHAKLKLALGDALLCRNGRYCASAAQRGRRLEALDDPLLDEQIRGWHKEAVAYKFNPRVEAMGIDRVRSTQADLCRKWSRVFLAVEGSRLLEGAAFSNLQAYAGYRGRLFPQSPFSRNLLLALRDRLRRGGGLRPVWDYPRGGLYRALADCLHSEISALPVSSTGKWISGAPQGLPATAHRELYLKWWHYYS